jgi:HSP20 family molecular chaperone IbpA
MSEMQKDVAPIQGAPNGSAAPEARQPLWRATPELDVYESANEFLILLNVPGASPESVEVQVEGTEIHVRAQRASLPGSDVVMTVYERRVELPSEVDATSASAKLSAGVLQIQIQKSPSARRIRIQVNAS